MSGPRVEIEPHNCPRIDDLGGGCYLTIPCRDGFSAVTINSVSTESGAVQQRLPAHPQGFRGMRGSDAEGLQAKRLDDLTRMALD
jgi:hypothetical protein